MRAGDTRVRFAMLRLLHHHSEYGALHSAKVDLQWVHSQRELPQNLGPHYPSTSVSLGNSCCRSENSPNAVRRSVPMGTATLRVRFRSCSPLLFFPEGIPAEGPELLRVAILYQHQQLPLSRDSSNRGESHTFEILRKELCFGWRHGEQQFVVIPAV